jgi:hypothetical protein
VITGQGLGKPRPLSFYMVYVILSSLTCKLEFFSVYSYRDLLSMHQYKKPNLNAPRFRPGAHTLTNKDFINSFKEKYSQYKDKPDKEIKEIIDVFNRTIWESVLESRDGVELPSNLGFIFIGSCLSHGKRNYNYKHSNEHGQRLKNHNFATDGFVAKIFFTNYPIKYKYSMRELWAFKGHRDFTRAITKEYPENFTKYIVIDGTKQISELFEKRKLKEYAISKQQEDIVNYNEFDLD